MKKKFLSVIFTTLLTSFFIFAVCGAIVVSASAVYFTRILSTTETIDIQSKPAKKPSKIFALDSQTGTYKLIYQKQSNPSDIKLETELKHLPSHVADAFICVEDERYYQHNGVDYKRTIAALANEFINFYGSTHGGSTITQQLIKNITEDNEATWNRKIREIFRAIKVERKYTKDEILNAYLNTIYFGQDSNGCNMYGIEAAAIGYFGKSASELTISEAASLAAIPQNPYYENPISNYELNQERKNYALRKMFELGKISADEYELSVSQKVLVTNMPEFSEKYSDYQKFSDNEFTNPDVNSWAVDTAIYEFRQFLIDKYGYTEKRALTEFNNGGYNLYITINEDVQNELEKNYMDYTFFPKETDNGGEKIESSFVVMDYYGQILGIVGGIGEKELSLCWNHATMTHRQPGSTIKPVSTYGYGIENNLINWSSMFVDAPLPMNTFNGEQWPENYNNYWSYKSNTVNYFLKKSINTVPAQICMNFGAEPIFKFATQKMRLELDPEHDIDYAPMSVGATHNGPTLLNLVNSYLPFGNGGKYYKAHIISKAVNTTEDKTMFEHNHNEYTQVIGEDTAYIMNKLLQNVVNPNQSDGEPGTGVTAYLSNKTVAGKTGTTQNWRDIDFIGLTEDFVSGIWIGYPNGENPEAIQNTKSATVWKNVFGNFANNYKSQASYPECPFVKECHYCTETGLLAGAYCPASKEKGFYKKSDNNICTAHRAPAAAS
ncbi:MAG: hypothetical protein E7505_10570 [Ruminococcus sp.]|nr:hypothetical protein [Ruminococcus sp.]